MSQSLAKTLRAAADIIAGRRDAENGPTPNQLRALSLRAERLENEHTTLINAIKAGISVFESYEDSQRPGTAAWLWLNRAEEIVQDNTDQQSNRNGH